MALLRANNCSTSAVSSVSAYKPSEHQVKASINLLNYRAYCLARNNQYTQSAEVLTQLKHYELLNHDNIAAANVQQQIEQANYVAQHPYNPRDKNKPEISRAMANKLQQQAAAGGQQ